MEFQAGDGACRVLRLWLAGLGILAASLIGLLAGLFTGWLLVGSVLAGLTTLWGILWYAPRYARGLQGTCSSEAVRAYKGVLWKQELYIPISSLRTVESWATPAQRLFGCRCIVLRFAGGAAVLPLLPEEQAQQLARMLEEYAQLED